MKAALAFTVGLWTGALAMTAVGLYYLEGFDRAHIAPPPLAQDQMEVRLQLSQQREARAAAEAERLRQTVAELQGQLTAQAGQFPPGIPNQSPRATRRIPFWPGAGPEVPAWIVQSALSADPQSLPKLEQAATQNDLYAMDAVALLADRDNAESLTRIWSAAGLNDASRRHATMLLAATAEVNPQAINLLQSLTENGMADEQLLEAGLRGLETPNFNTRLTANPGIVPPPHFKTDYGLRLRILDNLREAVTDELLSATIDKVRERLVQQAAATTAAAQ
jgi:hypothetical protein